PELTELLPRLVHHFDQPFGNPTALLSYELSRLTRQAVTVALAGDGGDELFLGYPRYAGAKLAGSYRRVPSWIRSGLRHQIADRIPEPADGRHALRRAREFLSTGNLPLEQMYATWVTYFSLEERGLVLARPTNTSPAPEAFL